MLRGKWAPVYSIFPVAGLAMLIWVATLVIQYPGQDWVLTVVVLAPMVAAMAWLLIIIWMQRIVVSENRLYFRRLCYRREVSYGDIRRVRMDGVTILGRGVQRYYFLHIVDKRGTETVLSMRSWRKRDLRWLVEVIALRAPGVDLDQYAKALRASVLEMRRYDK